MIHTCPECGGTDIEENDREYRNDDNQGFWEQTTITYACNSCGCEYEVTETITTKVERIPVTALPA